jgi:hypothetical protein
MQECVGLDYMKCLIPEFGAPYQQDKPDAVAIRQLRPFDLTTKDDQLLTKESIFNQQVSSTEANVGKCAQS